MVTSSSEAELSACSSSTLAQNVAIPLLLRHTSTTAASILMTTRGGGGTVKNDDGGIVAKKNRLVRGEPMTHKQDDNDDGDENIKVRGGGRIGRPESKCPDSSTTTLPSSQQQQQPQGSDSSPTTSKKRMMSAVLPVGAAACLTGIYVVYPISMLLLFRISEAISWVRLFEHSHACRAHHSSLGHCAAVAGIHGIQISALVAIGMYIKKHSKNRKIHQIVGVMALLLMTSIASFKLGVDHLHLYQPPKSSPYQSSLQGKVAVVTGANRGIGLATAQALAERGAHVVLTCRTIAKCQPAVDDINNNNDGKSSSGGGSASAAVLDLSSLESAYALTQELTSKFPEIHYVFANAGTTPHYELTEEGLEDAFGGMHLAHMAMVLGLLPSLQAAAAATKDNGKEVESSRVIMVSSEMAINAAIGVFGPEPLFRGGPDVNDMEDVHGEFTRGDGTLGESLAAYGRAKLCNILFALELNRRMAAITVNSSNTPAVIAHAVHTGAVATASSRDSIKDVFKRFPGLSTIVGKVYFPLLWRHVYGGARVLLCAALSDAEYVLRGGQYLDALCHPFLPSEEETAENRMDDYKEWMVSFKSYHFHTDPVEALILADKLYSERLWDVSISLLEDSPARGVVQFAPST